MADEKTIFPKIVKQFGRARVVFDVGEMNPEMMDKVKEVVGQVKAKDSLYARVPMTPGVSHNEYLTEAQGDDPELMRRDDESPEEHAARILQPRMETAKNAFDILNAIAPLFKQPTIEWDDFKVVPIHEIRTFVFNVLNFCDCPTAAEFSPKRIVDGKQFK